MLAGSDGNTRCAWLGLAEPHYEHYHNEEW